MEDLCPGDLVTLINKLDEKCLVTSVHLNQTLVQVSAVSSSGRFGSDEYWYDKSVYLYASFHRRS